MKLVNQIGIDRIELSRIGIVDIDEAKLESVADAKGKGVISILRNAETYTNGEKQEISTVKIVDNQYFGTFKMNKIKSTERMKETRSAVMDFGVCGECSNLQNMSAQELHDRVGFLETYLFDVYGINACFESATIKSVEVNVTVPFEIPKGASRDKEIPALVDEFTLYKMLLGNLPNAGNLQASFGTQNKRMKYSTCMRKNDSKEVIFYDKGMQLKSVYDIAVTSHTLLRIEVKVSKSEAVKRILGHNELGELTQKDLNKMFEREIIDKINRIYENYFRNRKSLAVRLLKKYRGRNNSYPSQIVRDIRSKHEEGNLCLLSLTAFKAACSELVDSKHASDTYHRIQAREKEYPLLCQDLEMRFARLVYALNRAVDGDQITEIHIK